MKTINIVLPNQLFENSKLIENNNEFYLLEENLFFNQFNFHKQKIYFHRCTMKIYEDYLKKLEKKVTYIEAQNKLSDIINFINYLNEINTDEVNIIDPNDEWICKRLKTECEKNQITLNLLNNPSFLTEKKDLNPFFRKDKKKFFQTSFYKSQRLKYNILLDENQKPEGGKWTYDDQNRLKYPKDKKTPSITFPKPSKYNNEGVKYVNEYFSENYGSLNHEIVYPNDFKSAKKWLDDFLNERFVEFGPYEDAVLIKESIINHTLLSPLINCGILTPEFVISKILNFISKNNIPINSIEGLIRQLIGWREFIRGVYISKGNEERTKNFWGFNRKIPDSFYDGSTGIFPVDNTIKKINKTAYANHIERLMIIGNFMLLCEFDPDEVYKWFMEMFIDSYDWVMVPNVYGMSQFADGGMMSTKPYISGSNYIIKMSDYKKGEWCKIWDALFWNFLDKQRDFFLKNPRMRMLVYSFDKMDPSKKENYLITSNDYLNTL